MNYYCCNDFQESLILTASGAAEPEEAAQFLRHIEGCSVCREELKRLELIIGAIQNAGQQVSVWAPPENMHARVMSRLRSEGLGHLESTGVPSWTETFRLRFMSWPSARLASVIIVVLIMVGGLASWFGMKRGVSEIRPGAVGRNNTEMYSHAEPAGPLELRRAMAVSLDDFEKILRRNDRVLAWREPIAVPARSRSLVEY